MISSRLPEGSGAEAAGKNAAKPTEEELAAKAAARIAEIQHLQDVKVRSAFLTCGMGEGQGVRVGVGVGVGSHSLRAFFIM